MLNAEINNQKKIEATFETEYNHSLEYPVHIVNRKKWLKKYLLNGIETALVPILKDDQALWLEPYRQTLNFLEQKTHFKPDTIIKNQLDTGMKVSKWISRNPDFKDYEVPHFSFLLEELNICDCQKYSLNDIYALFLQKITSRKEHPLFLSSSIARFATCSYAPDFGSCYRSELFSTDGHNGQYSQAPFSLYQNDCTLVAYVPNGQQVRKRLWVHVSPDMDSLVLGRPYGNWLESEIFSLKEYIKEKLSLPFFTKPVWTKQAGCSFTNSDSTIYSSDTCHSRYTIKGHEPFREAENFPPVCIVCGDEICEDEAHGFCDDCQPDRHYCASCGEEIDEDEEVWIDGQVYCRNCCHYCDHCEEYTLQDAEEVRTGNGLENWCQDCIGNDAFCCPSCDQLYDDSEGQYSEDEGETYCPDCFDELHIYCDHCKDYRSRNGAIEITLDEITYTVCKDCIEDNEL